jgi:hypothetical protein
MTKQSTLRGIKTVHTGAKSDGMTTGQVVDGFRRRQVARKRASTLPHEARLSAEVEEAKALYCAKVGATRL